MLMVLAAYAEEESDQISTNTNWPIMKKKKPGGNITTKLYCHHIEKGTFTIKGDEANMIQKSETITPKIFIKGKVT